MDNTSEVFYHGLDNYGHWSYNIFENKIEKILVYDSQTDEFLYEIINENLVDYIIFS